MDIERITHKGLRRFFETGSAKGLVGDVDRIRKMLSFINAAGCFDELASPPNYGLHKLVGDKAKRQALGDDGNQKLAPDFYQDR